MSTLPLKQYDHEATNLREADGEPQGQQIADVSQGPTGGSGQDARAVDYALGKANDPKVKSIGVNTLKGWAGRQGK